MRRRSSLAFALVLLAALSACASSGDPDTLADDPAQPGADGTGDDPSAPPDDPAADPGLCVGDGSDGAACEVTADCEAPLVCLRNVCVGPRDPDLLCDDIDGKACAGADEVCVGGVCVVDPVLTGEPTCPNPGQPPELAGTWAMSSTLALREGLPGLVGGLLSISELLADFVEGNIDLGLPAPVEILIGALVEAIIDQYVPVWGQDLIVMLAGFSDVLDDLQIDQTVVMSGELCEANYRGSSTWDRITFEYRGQQVSERPEDIPEIGPVTPEDFGARYACGQLFIDRHRVKNALQGLVRWMINTATEITTGYPTLELAIDAAVDCANIAVGINQAWRNAGGGFDITTAVETSCLGFEADLLMRVTMLIDNAAIELSVVSLEGVADVTSERRLDAGVWAGRLLSGEFPGAFDASR